MIWCMKCTSSRYSRKWNHGLLVTCRSTHEESMLQKTDGIYAAEDVTEHSWISLAWAWRTVGTKSLTPAWYLLISSYVPYSFHFISFHDTPRSARSTDKKHNWVTGGFLLWCCIVLRHTLDDVAFAQTPSPCDSVRACLDHLWSIMIILEYNNHTN